MKAKKSFAYSMLLSIPASAEISMYNPPFWIFNGSFPISVSMVVSLLPELGPNVLIGAEGASLSGRSNIV